MTIGGAIAELQNLLNADDVPFYYKGGIEKVIETIQMEKADRKTESNSGKPNNCELQTIRCPKCGRTDYIRDMEKDMGIKGSHYKYKCINCNTYIKDEPTISKMEQVDEPQTELVRVKYHCINCAENGSYKCSKCDGEMYYKYDKDEPQTYITEDRDTQILDAWQVHHRSTTSVEDEPQTEREGE